MGNNDKPLGMSGGVPAGVEAIRHYVAMRDAKPFRQMDDVIHSVHIGTEWEAELRLSDLRLAAALASAPAGDGERTPFPDGPCPICHGRWYHASECPNAAWNAALARPRAAVEERAFQMGDPVEKISGSSWRGNVVGTYSTALTPEGYAVESDTEVGSVQIYPAKALRLARPRAAVGEQSRLRRLTEEEARELVGFEPETILTCLREWGYVEDAALQSPPAKVEE